MEKLSSKDKKLLVLLGILLILFIPYYFFTSKNMEKIAIKNTEIEKLRIEEQSIITRRNLLEDVKEEASRSKLQMEKMLPNTAPMYKTYEIHYLFTRLIQDRGLNHQQLAISDILNIDDLAMPANALDKFDNTNIGLTSEQKIELDTSGKYLANKMQISFVVKGSLNNVLGLCEDIKSYSEYIVIDSLTIPNVNEPSNVDATFAATIYLSSQLPSDD